MTGSAHGTHWSMARLLVGLCFPGLGAAVAGRFGAAVLALWAVVYLGLTATADYGGWLGGEGYVVQWATVRLQLQFGHVTPTVLFTVGLAAAVHVGSALDAARVHPAG
ncbi:MAG: hypothetical protein EXR79_07050 [Myxococcales bacterium]|nr:hypothetical protein [Myxococcales bacterium]